LQKRQGAKIEQLFESFSLLLIEANLVSMLIFTIVSSEVRIGHWYVIPRRILCTLGQTIQVDQ